MNRICKQDYLTEEYQRMQSDLKQVEKDLRERALAAKLVQSIPQQRKRFVLEILSTELATKG